MEDKNDKVSKSKKIPILQRISLLIAYACIIYFFLWAISNIENSGIHGTLSEYVDSNEETVEINNDETNDSNTSIKTYNIDLSGLKEKNPDTVAWLKVNGTNIEYPVVKASNNDFYLNHNIDKSTSLAGWIFMDYRNNYTLDKNVVIYGHNIKNGSMFGSLQNVLSDEWHNNVENRYISYVTSDENMVYEVFSTYQIEAEDFYATRTFSNEKRFMEFLNTIQARSNYDYNVKLKSTDNILTLSTCANNNKYRTVLHARKLDIKE